LGEDNVNICAEAQMFTQISKNISNEILQFIQRLLDYR
jgi:hypothetical protein